MSRGCVHRKTRLIEEPLGIGLFQCDICGVILNKKLKSKVDSKKIYKDYYQQDSSGRFYFGIENFIKMFRFFRAWGIMKRHPKTNKVLDIGSGRGLMLNYLKKYFAVKEAVGTQIEENSYKYSKYVLGLDIYNQDLLNIRFKRDYFDVVSLWHVLEHLENPEGYLSEISRILAKNGVLIIEVPNFKSWTRKLSGRYWLSYDLKHHLFFFDKQRLAKLLTKHGFQINYAMSFSLEYSAFTSAQSIVSKITATDQIFFYSLQRKVLNSKLLINTFLFALFFLPCLVVNLILSKTNYGEVIYIEASLR